MATLLVLSFCLFVFMAWSGHGASAKIGGWDTAPNTQYHIQTDEGPERFFRYQTISGQYRKEKRLQDGSVVGSYGWVDANGFLRLRDYIADDKGYRIVRTKMVKVGLEPSTTTTTPRPAPISLSNYLKEKQVDDPPRPTVDIVPNGYPSSTQSPINAYIQPTTYRPYYYGQNSLDQKAYESQQQQAVQQQLQHVQQHAVQQQQQSVQQQVVQQQLQNVQQQAVQQQLQNVQQQVVQQQLQSVQQQVQVGQQQIRPQLNYQPQRVHQQQQTYESQQSYQEPQNQQEVPYDGVSLTQNGFRYYLPRHYHEEETQGDTRAGSFGYIDPFGIRRVIYYNADPSSGFVHRKNNRYVGFSATPFDPRY